MIAPELRLALQRVPLFAQSGLDALDTPCLGFLRRGHEVRLQPGEQLVAEGKPAAFYVLLEGELRVTKRIDNQENFLIAYAPGTFFGELPLVLGTPFIASAYAAAVPCRLFRLDEAGFWEMIAACPFITRTILRTVAARLRDLESVAQNRAKIASLGTLAAGLAHELNNPAGAARRAADAGRDTEQRLQNETIRLAGLGLSPGDWETLRALAARRAPELDPLAQSDREDEIASWLDEREIAESWRHAATLVRANVDAAALNALAGALPAGSLETALSWLDAAATMNTLWDEMGSSARRISDLVGAVKGYTLLDQAPLQEVDIHDGLEATLAVLAHKLDETAIVVTRRYDQSVPRLCAYGSALNQVWTNLLDNAIDALGDKGNIVVRTERDGARAVLVTIEDDGPGVPAEIQARIFEPFFTTKGVGRGSGNGLVTSFRVVAQHRGQIRLDDLANGKGGTRFTVRLPLDQNGV